MFKQEINQIDFDVKKHIVIKGARVHNLKNVNLVLPKNKLIVFTGVSGSGKSSIAFDTIYAEGQRRYVESLSAYSRQFLERMEKPDVDLISGIAPAISIEQKTVIKNPRSTVGTTTEIYDYLRLLFSRIGETICYSCGKVVKKDNVKTVLDFLYEKGDGLKIYILFPFDNFQGITKKEKIDNLRKAGFYRFFYNNEIIELDKNDFNFKSKNDVYVLVDRLVIRKNLQDNRYADSIETAFNAGNGEIAIYSLEEKKFYKFSKKFECADCNISYDEPDIHLFSFNNPRGACKECHGFGQFINFSMNLVVSEPEKSLEQGAIKIFGPDRFLKYYDDMLELCRTYNISTKVPFKDLSKEARRILILGDNFHSGIRDFFKDLEKKLYIPEYSSLYYKYRGVTTCPECEGTRLKRNALFVHVGGKNIRDIVEMNIDTAISFFDNLKLTEFQYGISYRILEEIKRRLKYLSDVGLGYITLNRSSYSLSGGESQRISLASALGAALVGSIYVLDEPSIGLHPRDNNRLINILKKLRDNGNTVIVVEHDYDMMEAADYIVDLGPKAGENGGEIVALGTFEEIKNDDNSLTGKYLSKKLNIKVPEKRRVSTEFLEIFGANKNNLKNVNVKIPLNSFVCVTGVSGSGKSSLIIDVLYSSLKNYYNSYSLYTKDSEINCYPFGASKITGIKYLNDVELVDQSPIGKSTRSNPVTYMEAYEIIRELFAKTIQAKERGYTTSHFSFNSPEGRCDLCQGEGYVTIEMQFMADIVLPCESCKGKRFKNEILDVKYKGKNIHEVLNLTVNEAITFFEGSYKRLIDKFNILKEVGLGYLRLGQSSSTLSGGEAQRLKLAYGLDNIDKKKKKLFIFDEPTTGLHFDDISKLLNCFNALVEKGNSVVVIEHNLDVIKTADYIIDIGPEGGSDGGRVIAVGPPEEIVKYQISHTGRLLKQYLNL
jgi:excinuclease ABC subunit A